MIIFLDTEFKNVINGPTAVALLARYFDEKRK